MERRATRARGSAAGPLAPLPPSFYRRPAEAVARDLLGRYLVREVEGETLVLRLVEVEAYLGAPDRASHAWGGRRTPRNASLYLPGGHAYVYFIYGMHWCLNAVTGEADIGSAVLLRAGEPVAPGQVATGPRIGVAYAGEAAAWPLRFAVADNRHVSRPRLVGS